MVAESTPTLRSQPQSWAILTTPTTPSPSKTPLVRLLCTCGAEHVCVACLVFVGALDPPPSTRVCLFLQRPPCIAVSRLKLRRCFVCACPRRGRSCCWRCYRRSPGRRADRRWCHRHLPPVCVNVTRCECMCACDTVCLFWRRSSSLFTSAS